MNSLAVRILSAAVAVAVLLVVTFQFGAPGIYFMAGLAVVLCLREFARFLDGGQQRASLHSRLFLLSGLSIFVSSYFSPQWILPTFWLSSLILVTFLLLQINSAQDRKAIFQVQCFSVLGLFYCGILPALLCQVLTFANGPGWFLTGIAIVFFGDSCAYFAGRAYGNHKLFALVSPKKTWEGALGGLIGSVIFGCLFSWYFLPDVVLWKLALVAAACGALGQVGDLFESLVKRVAQVKDSGSIMPGHGGMLDRIDGVLFAGPAFYYLAKFFLI